MALMQSRDEKDAADEKDDDYKASADKDGDRRKGRCGVVRVREPWSLTVGPATVFFFRGRVRKGEFYLRCVRFERNARDQK